MRALGASGPAATLRDVMEAATAAIAHKRVKRALGMLRAASKLLAPVAGDLDVVGELELEQGDDVDELLELVALARRGRASVDVVILARPAASSSSSSSVNGAPPAIGDHGRRATVERPHPGPTTIPGRRG